MFAGVGIGLGNALSLATCLLLPAIGYALRIPREEALLRRELGDSYADYQRQHEPAHTRPLVMRHLRTHTSATLTAKQVSADGGRDTAARPGQV